MTFSSNWENPDLTTRISAGVSPLTLVNVFTTKEGQQQAFCDAQIAEYRRLAGMFPGQLAANLHRGLAGRKVVNYAQFTDEAAYRQWRNSDEFDRHREIIRPFLDNVEPELYEVLYVQHSTNGT